MNLFLYILYKLIKMKKINFFFKRVLTKGKKCAIIIVSKLETFQI